jgi:RimJ/RimL family protein N-acetyltransferase
MLFQDQPVLTGRRVYLEHLTEKHFDGYWTMMREPEGQRLTGTQHSFTEEITRRWLATRADHHDRADWAIMHGDTFVGEVVLNSLSTANSSVNFRIGLAGPHVYGLGYGTEATRLVVDYALGEAGLHRIELEVYDFNPRAQHVYAKCGFVQEGVRRDALLWDGKWHNAICMSILATDPRPSRTP